MLDVRQQSEVRSGKQQFLFSIRNIAVNDSRPPLAGKLLQTATRLRFFRLVAGKQQEYRRFSSQREHGFDR